MQGLVTYWLVLTGAMEDRRLCSVVSFSQIWLKVFHCIFFLFFEKHPWSLPGDEDYLKHSSLEKASPISSFMMFHHCFETG